MAGRPRQRAMVLELEQRTRIHFLDDEHTALDYVEEWQTEGGTLLELAEEISRAARIEPEVSAEQITRWLSSQFGVALVSARLAA
jgi:hypothetical protein